LHAAASCGSNPIDDRSPDRLGALAFLAFSDGKPN